MKKLLCILLLLAAGVMPARAATPSVHVLVFTMAGGCGIYPNSGSYFPGGCTTLGGRTVQYPPLIVPQGGSLLFVNLDTTDHTLTSGTCLGIVCTPDGLFDSGDVQQHQTADISLVGVGLGDHPFFCAKHFFTGLLTVQAIP